jgi:PPOX class probable F420-dependent enzyme
VAKLDIALTPEEVDDFLASSRTVHVATVGPSGQPHVVPLWYVWLDGTMFVNTTRGNRSVRDLGANPRAAATVDDGESYEDLRGVVLHGRLEEADGDPRLDRVVRAFSKKYYAGNPPPFMAWKSRFFLKLEAERVASWDFRKIPEARARRDAERRSHSP